MKSRLGDKEIGRQGETKNSDKFAVFCLYLRLPDFKIQEIVEFYS